MQEKLNELSCRHRFWKLIARHAPVIVEDLIARGDAEKWSDSQWLEHWRLVSSKGRQATGFHPTVKAWAERWSLTADWALELAEKVLTNRRGRKPARAWLCAVGDSVYYDKLPPIEIDVWRDGEAWELPPKDECRQRILAVLDSAIDEYYGRIGAVLPPQLDLDEVAIKDFDRDGKWLILYLCLNKKDPDIADMENTGKEDAPGVETIRKGRKRAAKILGLRLPPRQGRPEKPETKASK